MDMAKQGPGSMLAGAGKGKGGVQAPLPTLPVLWDRAPMGVTDRGL